MGCQSSTDRRAPASGCTVCSATVTSTNGVPVHRLRLALCRTHITGVEGKGTDHNCLFMRFDLSRAQFVMDTVDSGCRPLSINPATAAFTSSAYVLEMQNFADCRPRGDTAYLPLNLATLTPRTKCWSLSNARSRHRFATEVRHTSDVKPQPTCAGHR